MIGFLCICFHSDSLGEEVEVMPLQSRQQDEPPLDIVSDPASVKW